MNGRCAVLAEIGSNHGGSTAKALNLIKMSADCGADGVKLQKRDNRTLYTKRFYKSAYNSENAYAPTYGEHREALELDKGGYVLCKQLADELGVTFIATAFDEPSVDFLRDLDLCTIKIASGSLRDVPLISYASDAGAKLLISTGGGDMDDIARALDAAGDSCIGLLHCTAEYPAKDEHLNLRCIQTYKQTWPHISVGASLHSRGVMPAVAAYTLGARILEMHVTDDRTQKGTDHAFSLEPSGLRKLVSYLRRMEVILGDGEKVIYPEEEAPIRKMSRSVYTSRSLAAGSPLDRDNLVLRTPAVEGSLPAYRLHEVIGRKLVRDMEEEEPIFEDHVA